MKLKSDERCRLSSPELFKPNTVYEGERKSDGRIILSEASGDIPLLKPRRVDGRLRGAEVNLSRTTVAAAIRSDRDSR